MDLQDETHSCWKYLKYKARFVARGFSQKEGIDYEDIFSLVVRYTSIKTIISLVVLMKWKVH
jgi:hypothetical protein